jgi:hypothetical protein
MIECHPVEHLVEEPRITAGNLDGEEDEGLGIDCPSIGAPGSR